MDDTGHREREKFFGAAKVMAVLTLLSRIMGMFRAMAITALGTTRVNDAFEMAWSIPNLFRRLFGEGALASAFVPIFTDVNEKEGHDRADALLSNAIGLLGVFLLAVLAVVLCGLWVWSATSPGDSDQQILIGFLAIMMPFMVTVCLLALCSAALNCRGHFAYPAAAPILLNLVIIVAAVYVAGAVSDQLVTKLYVVAASVTVGGIIHLAIALVLLRRIGFSVRPRLWPLEPYIRRGLRMIAPMLLGLGLLQFNEIIERGIAWMLTVTRDSSTLSVFGWTLNKPLTEGVLVRLGAARYLYQFPMGVLATSLAVAVFPLMSRYALRGDIPSLRDTLNRALRLALMEGLATGAGLFLLAEPITAMLYIRGNFKAADAVQAAYILRMYVLGMWALCTYQILARAFYSLNDTLTPVKVSCSLIVLELALVCSLVWSLGAGAFGLATAIVFSVNSAILAFLLRRKLGRFGGRRLAASAAKSLIACGAMAVVVLVVQWQLAWRFGNTVVVAACVPAGAAAFIGAAKLLRMAELGELLGGLRNRKKKATEDRRPEERQEGV